MSFSETTEGQTRLVVPTASLRSNPPPTSPVFFNPAASVNRDVSVAIAQSSEGATFCDAMAGVGARGIRAANEVGKIEKVFLVDLNAEALGVAKTSAELNQMQNRCEFRVADASSFLLSRFGRDGKFDFVDIDPFGSPVRQLDAGVSATGDGGILSVTATDTAVLCGVYPSVSRRRYGADSINNHFHHETGIRILVNAISRIAARRDFGAYPVAAHSTRHYLRVYLRLRAGASLADSSLTHEGFVSWCPACGFTSDSKDRTPKCQECGGAVKVAGPLWLGRLIEENLVATAAAVAEERGFRDASKILGSLTGVDRFPPWSFSIDGICSSIGIATVPEQAVRDNLAASGFESFRQPFEPRGLKTHAKQREIVDAVRASHRSSASADESTGNSAERVLSL